MTKRLAVLGALLGALVCLVSGLLPWATLNLDRTQVAQTELTVTGQNANPTLLPLALAALAGAVALTIAGRVLRYALAVVLGGLGVSLALAPLGFMAAPTGAAETKLRELSGLGGGAATDVVTGETVTFWPWLAVIGGVVLCAAATITVLSAHRWKQAGRKYEAAPERPARGGDSAAERSAGTAGAAGADSAAGVSGGGPDVGAAAEADAADAAGAAAASRDAVDDRISDWDMLSSGEDPTLR